MTHTTTCQHCNTVYTAKRSTSKFCSPKCRVASHREPSTKERYDALCDKLYETLRELHDLAQEDERIEYSVAATMVGLPSALKWMGGYGDYKWWMCRMCQTKTRGVFPRENACGCGDGAFWVTLDTSTDNL